MWCDELPAGASWTVLWRNLTICGSCSGICPLEADCSVCGAPLITRAVAEEERGVNSLVFMGAEGRYEDYIYLRIMEREWKRPILSSDETFGIGISSSTSSRAAIVLLFWTYFETRIDRLLRAGMRQIPEPLAEDTLRRYSFIGQRLDRLYKIIFGTTYSADLAELGHAGIADHLLQIQRHRNDFSHGNPQAIDDSLVLSVVENLKIEHEAWIAVYNKRIAKR